LNKNECFKIWKIQQKVLAYNKIVYSYTCIKMSPLEQRKRWPINTGDCLGRLHHILYSSRTYL